MRYYRFIIYILILLFGLPLYAKNVNPYNYEIVCAGNGEYGHYLVTVSAYVTKKKDINHDINKKCAIHGILYNGFTGDTGCHSQKPILSSTITEEQQIYISSLIEKQFNLYASSVDEMLKVLKVGKNYKVIAVIEVNASQLRKDLEKNGIIRKLGLQTINSY